MKHSSIHATGSSPGPIEEAAVTSQAARLARVRSILAARRARSRYFGESFFADPVWDSLLELYANNLSQHRVSVSSLCIASGVPTTTALRWINMLENHRLVVRRPDPLDKRRTFVELSHEGVARMNSLFDALPLCEPLI